MTLLEALKAWLVDATSDKPSKDVRYFGLCGYIFIVLDLPDLRNELRELFIYDKLDYTYPFGMGNFEAKRLLEHMHRCPKRLAWVRKTIKRLENKQCVNQS